MSEIALVLAPRSSAKDCPVSGLIGFIAAVCTIAAAAGGVFAWLRGHALIVRVHDPQKNIERDNLSVIDVARAMKRMAEDANRYKPDHIVGINRGGAIVGGWLAKQLQMEVPILLVVNSDEPQGRRVAPRLGRNGQLAGRIYLVDDAQRKGEHMREAFAYLSSKHPGVEIRRAILLQMDVPHQGPEAVAFRATPSEFVGYSTTNGSVVLPWDT
jgi:hypoxanthine phosphoribosyltransferase